MAHTHTEAEEKVLVDVILSTVDVAAMVWLEIEKMGSQRKFAKACGMSVQFLNDYVRGRIPTIPVKVLAYFHLVAETFYHYKEET